MNSPNNFTFSVALERLKNGDAVRRSGWNGKGMFLIHVQDWYIHVAKLTPAIEMADDLPVDMGPFIAMKTADDKVVPWLCSQTDMLAEDWEIVHGS